MDFLHRILPPARFRLLCMAMLVLTIVMCLMAYATELKTFQTAAVVCLALAVGGVFAFWRCPRCRRVLPVVDMLHVKKCPHCRADIEHYNGR